MRYAVEAGQRLRPLLTLTVARVLGSHPQGAMRAAIAVELLHCASLIVDDLPCMDNDSMRRNRAAVHIEFGEATAVLAAFALVSLAARSVADQPGFQMKLLATLDCDSLIGGQSLDLALTAQCRDRERHRITSLKTVPLFELAVEAGLSNGTASSAERESLLAFGRRFGIAYQTADDFLDGETSDYDGVTAQFDLARATLLPLGRRASQLEDLLDHLNARLREDNRSHR